MATVTAPWTQDNGLLRCSQCDSEWCEHIVRFIDEYEDGSDLWNHLAQIAPEPMLIKVPVVPEHNIFMEVQLVPTHDDKMYEVKLLARHLANLNRQKENQFIGYLMQLEGRAILVSMLDNWLFAQDLTKLECRQRSHSFGAQMAWEKQMKAGSHARRSEYWSVIVFGRCTACGRKDVGFDDLIPDAGKPNTPWSR